MNYIITSKNNSRGDSTNDIKNPVAQTEIATELIITRLYLFELLQSEQISTDDTIVCIEERKCLYTNIFKNVIAWSEFKPDNDSHVIDLLEENLWRQMVHGQVENRLIPYSPFYKHWERDKDLILNFKRSDISRFDLSEPFIALVIRKRAAWSEKNMTDQFWFDLLNLISDHNVFIFGKETEVFCNKPNTFHVPNYQDWCTLVEHENCKHICSTMTGGVYPALIFGHSDCKLTLIDNLKLMEKHGGTPPAGEPSFYGNCINFSQIPIEFINKIPNSKELYDKLI